MMMALLQLNNPAVHVLITGFLCALMNTHFNALTWTQPKHFNRTGKSKRLHEILPIDLTHTTFQRRSTSQSSYNLKRKGKSNILKVPQPQAAALPRHRRKRKDKRKSNKRTKSTKISSLSFKRGNRNAKRAEKHKNKITQGKTWNKSPRRINQKATKSKTNTGTTALEWSVHRGWWAGCGGGLKHFYIRLTPLWVPT